MHDALQQEQNRIRGKVSVPSSKALATFPAAFATRRGDMDFVNHLNSWIETRTVNKWLERRPELLVRLDGLVGQTLIDSPYFFLPKIRHLSVLWLFEDAEFRALSHVNIPTLARQPC
jgi:hypothetical protein